jgi:hypothetical protein
MTSCVLQERHHELLADFGRQVRVADIARQVQKDANLAVADAQRSTREVGCGCFGWGAVQGHSAVQKHPVQYRLVQVSAVVVSCRL